MGAVAGDVAGLFEPLHADQARAGRQAHGVGQIDVGHAAVLLQLRQDAQVQAVELEGFSHGDARESQAGAGILIASAARTSGCGEHVVQRARQAREELVELGFGVGQRRREAERSRRRSSGR